MDFKKKYLKYKIKYLELKQKGGVHHHLSDNFTPSDLDAYLTYMREQREQSIRSQVLEVPAYPNLPDLVILFVQFQLIYISNYLLGKGLGTDTFVDTYRGIRSGGSFTNKISSNGLLYDGVNAEELYGRTIAFRNFAKESFSSLSEYSIPFLEKQDKFESRASKTYFKVYRLERRHPKFIADMLRPIPFSCSWDINFPLFQWGGFESCCILEIIMSLNTSFLSTSNPDRNFRRNYSDNHESFQDYWHLVNQSNFSFDPDNIRRLNIQNDEQVEVVLPPCNLKYLISRTENITDPVTRVTKEITIYTFELNELNETQIKDIISTLSQGERARVSMDQ
jgi:hypothetical protein